MKLTFLIIALVQSSKICWMNKTFLGSEYNCMGCAINLNDIVDSTAGVRESADI